MCINFGFTGVAQWTRCIYLGVDLSPLRVGGDRMMSYRPYKTSFSFWLSLVAMVMLIKLKINPSFFSPFVSNWLLQMVPHNKHFSVFFGSIHQ